MNEEKRTYIDDFATLKPNGLPESFLSMRRNAFERFRSLPFPTTHEEEWRFTNVAPLLKIPFRAALQQAPANTKVDFSRLLPEIGPWRMVFINGRYSGELSQLPAEIVTGLRTEAAEKHFGRSVSVDENAFTAMNTAFLQDGSFLCVPAGLTEKEPVHIIYITDGVTDGALFPRNLWVLGKGAQMTMIESYIDRSGGRTFTNAVTEIVMEEGSRLQHIKLQQESPAGFHIASTAVRQGRDSDYTSYSIGLGSVLARENLRTSLEGPGASCSLNGLYLPTGHQHIDHHTTIDHVLPHSTSRELYKGILNESSSAVFHGRIIVRKDAQHTDARQTNKNILLSDSARINTTPQLEILADDVKCNHGATIGHLDEDAMFYLRSRGIAEADAQIMLMRGFLQEVTAQIKPDSVRATIDAALISRLAEFSGGRA